MTNEQAAKILTDYNIWRRGLADDMPYEPQRLGEAIDAAISVLSRAEADGSTDLIKWQKCPKCDGQGIVSRPPWIAGDVYEWAATSVSHQCNVCNGQMIIPQPPKTAQQ